MLVAAALWAIGIPAESTAQTASGPPFSFTATRVSGVVSVAGLARVSKPLPVFKNRAVCGSQVPDETMLIDAQGGLQNAAILLRPRTSKIKTGAARAVLDNHRCAFRPHIQIVTVGTELLLTNSDPMLHTVRARLGKETLFNVGLPRWRRVTKFLDRPGVVRIDCDVLHTWMSAAIVVADTPYFALSDEKGYFTLDGLPAGNYEMEVWHERLGKKSLDLSLEIGAVRSLAIVYAAP